MKKADIEKETKFVELFAVTGNATESFIDRDWETL